LSSYNLKKIIINQMELTTLKYIGVGLSAMGMLGAAIGVGNIFSSLLSAIARNPSAEPQMVKSAFIGAGLAEAMGLFSFLLAILLLFAV
jgi:F-type H+-transporting ATPase subunit c